MADAKRTIQQQIHDAQPGAVAKAFVDTNQIHDGKTYLLKQICVQREKQRSVLEVGVLLGYLGYRSD